MDQETSLNTTSESDTKEYISELTSSSSVSDKATISSSEKSYMIKDIMQDKQTDDDFEDTSVSKDLFAKESILNSFAQVINKKVDDIDESSDVSIDTKENIIKYIEDFMIDISEKTNWLDIIKYRFNDILSLSNKKFAAYYLVKHNVLQKMLKTAHTKPDIVEIVFRTIIIVCRNRNLISSIGKNAKFATAILTHLKSVHDSVLLCTLKFLKIAVRDIQRDHNSCWLSHLKTCEFFEHCVITIFKFQFNEALITTATDLLWEIARTNLPYHQPNLLEHLFNIQHNLIPVLMTSCMQMITLKKNKKIKDKKIDLIFVYNWLSIMTIIKTDLVIVFHENEERDKYTFLKILLMLHLYQRPDVLFPKQEIDVIRQNIFVIYKYMSLLLYIRCQFYVPLIMDENLIKIILNLKRVLDIESEEKNSDSVKLLYKFSQWLDKVWLNIVQNSHSKSITKLMKPLDQKERQYFLQLDKDKSHSHTSNKGTIDDKLNETETVILEFHSILG